MQAIDSEDAVLTQASITLTLKDVNDENPVFVNVPTDCQVNENSPETGFYNFLSFLRSILFILL